MAGRAGLWYFNAEQAKSKDQVCSQCFRAWNPSFVTATYDGIPRVICRKCANKIMRDTFGGRLVVSIEPPPPARKDW